MNSRTYYDILGVSREATLQEITSAKNALAKVYRPDANMNQGIDTTACMQEILEAYRVLSNPESRHEYDKELGGGQIRVFRTFTVGPEDDEQAAPFVRPEKVNTNEDISLMYFTSGTTGEPKMVAHDFTYPLGHISTGS